MTGYEDLDQYGDWSYVAGYGMVWRPTRPGAGLGALPLRTLDLGGAVGLDLGGE